MDTWYLDPSFWFGLAALSGGLCIAGTIAVLIWTRSGR